MNKDQIDISIVIVNYRVKEYIANLLKSLENAKSDFTLQTIIVDNNSKDDSVSYLKSRFPEVTYIENTENVGFGKANNQAFQIAEGKYTLIINPDTLISEETLQVMVNHMEQNPECGASGCKILNPDGTFAPESKRSVPTLRTAVSKVLGLNNLFPESKIFGKYYLGWIDEDETASVPVLSGSFMFWRTDVLKKLGGFDERFFMYGEDIDLCYRIQETDFHIDYVPTTSIIHYKGESTRKGDLKYVKIFNKALYQFFDKHHSSKYSYLFRGLVFTAIWMRVLLSFLTSNLLFLRSLATDLLLLNVSVILGFLIRFSFSVEVFTNLQSLKYLWINVLASVFYLTVGSALELFRQRRTSISDPLKAVFASYVGVAVLTFFVRNLAFSRLALIYGLIGGVLLIIVHRLILINSSKTVSKVTGRISSSKIILVGSETAANPIKQQIYSRPDWNYDVVGVVRPGEEEGNYIGSLSQLRDLIRAYNIDQVFFLLASISYKTMLQLITTLQNEKVIIKLVPDTMDFILGKSNVEYLERIPLVDVGLSYTKSFNRFLKRCMDIAISLPLLLLFFPVGIPSLLFANGKKERVRNVSLIAPFSENGMANRFLLLWNVLIGKLHLVGARLDSREIQTFDYKAGLTGYSQINKKRIRTSIDSENYELYYLQNYSIWLDIDIMMKSMYSGYSVLSDLDSANNN